MTDALMLRYRTQPPRTWGELDHALQGSVAAGVQLLNGAALDFSLGSSSAPRSLHARPWLYPVTHGAPGMIRLWHVWLDLPPPANAANKEVVSS
jgi:hypothetical protein